METGVIATRRLFVALIAALCLALPVRAEMVQMTPVADLSDAKANRLCTFQYDTVAKTLSVDVVSGELYKGRSSGFSTDLGGTQHRIGPFSRWEFYNEGGEEWLGGGFVAIINEQSKRILYLGGYPITAPYLDSMAPDARFVMLKYPSGPLATETPDPPSPARRFQVYDAEGVFVFGDTYADSKSEWTPEGLLYAKVGPRITDFATDPIVNAKPHLQEQAKACPTKTGWILEWYLLDMKTKKSAWSATKPEDIYCAPVMYRE